MSVKIEVMDRNRDTAAAIANDIATFARLYQKTTLCSMNAAKAFKSWKGL